MIFRKKEEANSMSHTSVVGQGSKSEGGVKYEFDPTKWFRWSQEAADYLAVERGCKATIQGHELSRL